MVRSRMPVSKWDFSSRDWLKSDASSDPEQFKSGRYIRRPMWKRVSERLIAFYLESGHTLLMNGFGRASLQIGT
jgi:hypothetical protein